MKSALANAGIAAGILSVFLVGAAPAAHAVSLLTHGSVSFSPFSFGDIDVNPLNDRVYVGSGFGSGGVAVLDFANPDAPASLGGVAGAGSGMGVNRTTGNFYTIDGGFNGRMREFSAAGAQTKISQTTTTGCGGSVAVNQITGIVYATTQCADSLHRYDPTLGSNGTITNVVALGMVGSDVRVNEFDGRVYARNGSGGSTKVYDGTSLGQVGNIGMVIKDTDGVNNRLYFADGTVLRQLDGTTLLQTGFLNGDGNSAITVDDVHNWLFVATGGTDVVRIYDGATMTLLDSVALGGGQQIQRLATGGDGFVYAMSCAGPCTSETMTAIEVVSGVPEPASLAVLALGLAGMGAARRRRG